MLLSIASIKACPNFHFHMLSFACGTNHTQTPTASEAVELQTLQPYPYLILLVTDDEDNEEKY